MHGYNPEFNSDYHYWWLHISQNLSQRTVDLEKNKISCQKTLAIGKDFLQTFFLF